MIVLGGILKKHKFEKVRKNGPKKNFIFEVEKLPLKNLLGEETQVQFRSSGYQSCNSMYNGFSHFKGLYLPHIILAHKS